MKKLTLLTVAILAAFVLLNMAKEDAERKAVTEAVLDYVEGVYEVAPKRIERSVSPNLAKRGFYQQDGEYHEVPMTFEQLVDLSKGWNKDGKSANENSPKKVEIYEILDKTASVKLTAEWGIDYMHLAKYDDKWQIVNVLWQSHPPEGTNGEQEK